MCMPEYIFTNARKKKYLYIAMTYTYIHLLRLCIIIYIPTYIFSKLGFIYTAQNHIYQTQ